MMKAFKYRMYPNQEQREYFTKTFGSTRFIYNRMLHDKIEHYKLTEQTLKNTPAQYKTEFPWLKEVDSLALANAQMNLEKAYKNFFRDKSVGFPKFKSKKNNHRSYTTNNQKGTISIENNYIKLPKLKSAIKIKQHRLFDGLIKSCTISQTPSGKYFVSVLVECEIEKMPQLETKIGVDVGLKTFAVLSNRTEIENPKYLRKSEKRLTKLQKDLSRKTKGSNNRAKARLKVAQLHEKITNQRMNFLHKKSFRMIRDNQVIVLEDLKVKNMVKNHKLAKAISEVSWGMFRQLIEYKTEWYGRQVIIAPSNYASSQLCSDCGNKSSQTKDLSCRTYICKECGLEIDRDYNASLNLLKLAI
ncbi:IS200/IS605 family element RNA-guided endonuclease TnpB [Pelosinus sp. sgz500959]|uniref:IS200/IS605 family element RNA-guided endonuclease TnpB n=1 Tax=Pelosinus sp. sgz500959 TaxID=3242472 RepID=UPI00366CB28F